MESTTILDLGSLVNELGPAEASRQLEQRIATARKAGYDEGVAATKRTFLQEFIQKMVLYFSWNWGWTLLALFIWAILGSWHNYFDHQAFLEAKEEAACNVGDAAGCSAGAARVSSGDANRAEVYKVIYRTRTGKELFSPQDPPAPKPPTTTQTVDTISHEKDGTLDINLSDGMVVTVKKGTH